jgi:hypothetical protein
MTRDSEDLEFLKDRHARTGAKVVQDRISWNENDRADLERNVERDAT